MRRSFSALFAIAREGAIAASRHIEALASERVERSHVAESAKKLVLIRSGVLGIPVRDASSYDPRPAFFPDRLNVFGRV
jgi:hypothetical protein